ncbi:MAG: molybdopterin synthase catalytic subunit MoaE [Rhodocyclaceae bacterium]|nr:molybdopterin synthase catalytic subunit MoaE [Rhodocyclaceae bacterium]
MRRWKTATRSPSFRRSPAASVKICVQTEDFDLGAECAAIARGRTDIGAVASFVGLVRGANDGGGISRMTLEHYPGMTEKSLAEIVGQARGRWDVMDATVIHRVGALRPGDNIVLVVVASAHRGDAFAACEFIMDYLKTRAPFWKKEETAEGGRWVDARESDDVAAEKWRA